MDKNINIENYNFSNFDIGINFECDDELKKNKSLNSKDIKKEIYYCFHLSHLETSLKNDVEIGDGTKKCLKNKFIGYKEWTRFCSAVTVVYILLKCII